MEPNHSPTFVPFPSIGQYRDAVFTCKALEPEGATLPVVNYTGKVKIHGTNAGIIFDRDGTFHCQSREKIIAPGDDNAGFAKWAHEHIDRILDLDVFNDYSITGGGSGYSQLGIFGEWCGGKISPNVALSQAPRMFVVFAVCRNKPDMTKWINNGLTGFKSPEIGLFNVDLFGRYDIEIDFSDPGAATEQIKAWTIAVEDRCPAGAYFGVEGVGEGIVFTAAAPHDLMPYSFKSKGTKHEIAAKMGSLDPIAMNELSRLVDLIMRTGQVESRVEQAVRMLKERGHAMESMRDTKLLVDWLVADIEKENLPDIEASSFGKNKIIGGCLSAAKQAYKAILDRF